ncbi:MAG: iron-containing alcohol dehydrogenase [Firmicutes bacterium]|nr:iron-containing alcohol dehydrogenase [Bacillota bacterium]
MLGFTYYTPTKVVFGPYAELKTGELVAEQGAKKVLIHYGSERVKRTGLIAQIEKSLDELGIGYVELGGVVPNPRLSKVYEGIELCRKEGVDFLLAVGGGSVADSAKAIGYGLANEGDVWDFFDLKRKPAGAYPVGVVLTISATGSEMSNSTVITNEDGWLKRSCNTDYIRPRFAVLNPTLTMTLPEYQTMSGCTDIMMHTLERYLNNGGAMDLTDEIAEGLLRTVMRNALILLDEPENYDARAEIMWAGSLSHNGLTGCGTDGGDWACHRLEHEVGGMFDVAHGAGLAAIWGTWARYVYKNNPARFAKLAVNVLGVTPCDDDEATALAGIGAMEEFFRSIHMPVSLTELGVHPTDEEYKELAHKAAVASPTGTLGSVMKLQEADMEAIFRAAQ